MLYIEVKTKERETLVNITGVISALVENSGIKNGICIVYVPHTTAAITINESADPDVVRDIIDRLKELVPHKGDYAHSEGNSDAHIKASIIGNSRIIIVENGKLALGTWEGIFLCEFDGPRTRKVFVKII
ncbi:MAG: secondary thiamine-phosphate synthase enzyme YjbQ [Deltaproteobacteria bacterium]|nr:secondary thiamine-phosphate synthase enzyme YjbQ [Deltaproteobacteria bacterium]